MTRMNKLTWGAAALFGLMGTAVAQDQPAADCALGSLQGRYVITATGFSAELGPWMPKAIVELVTFNGDGTLAVPGATIANSAGDGRIVHVPAGGTGTYTLAADCTGTMQFTDGPSFDIFVGPDHETVWLIQTNDNQVMQGKLERLH